MRSEREIRENIERKKRDLKPPISQEKYYLLTNQIFSLEWVLESNETAEGKDENL